MSGKTQDIAYPSCYAYHIIDTNTEAHWYEHNIHKYHIFELPIITGNKCPNKSLS